jgi:hypothetical protein
VYKNKYDAHFNFLAYEKFFRKVSRRENGRMEEKKENVTGLLTP